MEEPDVPEVPLVEEDPVVPEVVPDVLDPVVPDVPVVPVVSFVPCLVQPVVNAESTAVIKATARIFEECDFMVGFCVLRRRRNHRRGPRCHPWSHESAGSAAACS